MKRKLCSVLMSLCAILLLMGAGVERDQSSALLTVAAADIIIPLEELLLPEEAEEIVAEAGVALSEAEVFEPVLYEAADDSLLLNGEPVSVDTQKVIVNGVSYVSLRAMAEELDETAVVSWEEGSATATLTTAQLYLTAQVGETYLVANDRYLYVPQEIQLVDGVVMVPLTVLAKAFDATVEWDSATGTISVVTGSGAIASGDVFYNSDDLFWMSRIIFAESGSEVLEGKIAVGNVVLNRVASPIYPDTLLTVLAQKNQFSTYKNGSLANRTPNETSIIAAKLVLDGAVVAGLETATHFDTGGSTWASKNKTCVAIIGGHKFYG